MHNITAIILTKNEELNIGRCIQSVKPLADRIVVVDSGSEDQTITIAKKYGAEVYKHPFEHYAAQFNWALDNVDIKTTWVYRIDADEMVPEDLRLEIVEQCEKHRDDEVNGFLMKHRINFLGPDLIHGGAYPFRKITIFKAKYGRFENRAMGEHVVLQSGTYLELEHDCIHYDFKSLTDFVEKHNLYATREVQDYYERRFRKQRTLYTQAERVKRLRDGVYYHLPPFLRAHLYYLYRYYIQLGFLDGVPGRVYAFIQAYFYRYLVDAKIYEAELEQNG